MIMKCFDKISEKSKMADPRWLIQGSKVIRRVVEVQRFQWGGGGLLQWPENTDLEQARYLRVTVIMASAIIIANLFTL